ncbi:hypothetical protein OC842_002267 [Tilletia horrida]|uniref:Selenoprotein O n=1 Tax=Tilletia horrida TaxID=155126 RepID=A0AAN6GDZ1_9BASI|nr:hypothetical protein OC842_002267 [Tilletia horrida]
MPADAHSSSSSSSSSSKMATATAQRLPILALPLLSPAARLATNLIPDPCTPAPRSLLAQPGKQAHPSFLRRARPVTQGAHFSFVTPLPLEFPYEIPVSTPAAAAETEGEGAKLSDEERARLRMVQMEEYIKRWEIATDEATRQDGAPADSDSLRLFIPAARHEAPPFAPFRLLGVSPSALPQLDVGDARAHILSHSSKPVSRDTATSGPGVPQPDDRSSDEYKRWTLSQVLSGHGVAARFPSVSSQSSTQEEAVEGVGVAHLKWQEARKAGAASDLDDVKARLEALAKRQQEAVQYDPDVMPWSQAYAGHQFGEWAGQLGDGRAVSLFEVALPTPISSTLAFPRPQAQPQPSRTDIQLKGAGRTPYSRFADGLATTQSSLREFLCAEYMGGGLGIESCRGLAVGVYTKPLAEDGSVRQDEDGVRVRRERWHPAAVMTRLAPSWVRIGSFELHASRGEWESARVLGEYAAQYLFEWDLGIQPGQEGASSAERKAWALRLVKEVAVRNAKTIARWQVAGFMHGVMNTDNIAVLGHTIDYGPYAFMDLFDEDRICNHSDSFGRYSYKMQPSMGLFAIEHLFLSLSPLIGYEEQHGGRAPAPGVLGKADEKELQAWSDAAEETHKDAVKALYMRTLKREWTARWLGRIGLSGLDKDGKGQGERDEELERELIDPLLVVLEQLDFSTHLRRLADFPALLAAKGLSAPAPAGSDESVAGFKQLEAAAEEFVGSWIDETHVRSYLREKKREAGKKWLLSYARLLLEQGTALADVKAGMLKTNPRFVLRNWVTTEVADRVEKNFDTAFLDRVLQMCLDPFHEWGSPADGKSAEIIAEEKRLCEVGTPLEGHLPSCSS